MITTTFSPADPPNQVCALLTEIANALPQRKTDGAAAAMPTGSGEYRLTVALKSPADESAAQATFLSWLWYAARREGLHLDGEDDDFSTTERVEEALRAVVAPALRLSRTDQQSLQPHARIVRYAAHEIVERAAEVPTTMTFLITGSVRLTAVSPDGSALVVGTMDEGSFLGVTALTRQPNLTDAHAIDELTALQIDRTHLVDLVMGKPLLLQDLGRTVDERRAKVDQALDQALQIRGSASPADVS
jgi:CRP-like cAMP-binding protein